MKGDMDLGFFVTMAYHFPYQMILLGKSYLYYVLNAVIFYFV